MLYCVYSLLGESYLDIRNKFENTQLVGYKTFVFLVKENPTSFCSGLGLFCTPLPLFPEELTCKCTCTSYIDYEYTTKI